MTDGANQGRNGQTPPAVHARADLDNTNTLPDTFTLDHGGGCEALAASHVNAVPARVKHAPAKPENAEPFLNTGAASLAPGGGGGSHPAAPATIAALYVETDGAYFGLHGVDPWDEARDARNYAGPWPVVAHPPCQRWGAMAAVNFARWGGEHNRPGNDSGCFASALAAVRTWGGVLEHPAKSRAWDAYGLTKPSLIGWQRCADGGWVCEVWQAAYGHRANKATWLYAFGVGLPPALKWERPVGTHQVGFHDQRGKDRNKPTLSKREASATPIEFRNALIAIAHRALPSERAA